MQITILYATYSNSTYTAADALKNALEKLGHQVEVRLVNTANVETLSKSDLTIFASPSWDYNGKEGQPHEDFFGFFERVHEGVPPESFSYAIMALGDSNYTFFCGAVDEIAVMADRIFGKQVIEPLKLDQFYLNESSCVAAIEAWANKLTATTNT